MFIIKRDGRRKEFDASKIVKAIEGAMLDMVTKGHWSLQELEANEYIASEIAENITSMLEDVEEVEVETIQDMVEVELEGYDRVCSTMYRSYRDDRTRDRNAKENFKIKENIIDKFSDRASNGNLNENTFSGKENRILEDKLEEMALNEMSSEMVKKHLLREVYIHDLNKWAMGVHNCLQHDIESCLNEGAEVGQGDIRPTTRFSTAMQLIPVYLQIQSQCQFGGVSVPHFDYIMQPYVERLIGDKLREMCDYHGRSDVALHIPDRVTLDELQEAYDSQIYNIIIKKVKKQIHESCQALITNLVTLQSRPGGQTPFSSINTGANTSREGLMLNRILLEELDRGIGRKNITAIYPIVCYQTGKGINLYEGDPGFELTKYAIQVQSRRHYPTFVNLDWSELPKHDDWRLNHCRMGCRTGLTSDINANTPEERYAQVGRGNFAPVTLGLPIIAMRAKREAGENASEIQLWAKFYDILQEDCECAKDNLLMRYNKAIANPVSVAPAMYLNHVGIDTKDAKTPEDFLKHCTLAIGHCGLYEAYEILTGRSFYETEEDLEKAVEIIATIDTTNKAYTQKYHLNFSSYATPAESLVGKIMTSLKENYGYISDKKFVTNSFHVPVWDKISPFKKIDIESRFSKLANGGSIFHCEVDGETCNVTACLKVLQYAMESNIPYFRFSHKTCTCRDCGYKVETYMPVCRHCGSENVSVLTTITGYLTNELTNMNAGKVDEVLRRVILPREE